MRPIDRTGPGGEAAVADRRIRNPLDPRNPLSGVYIATMLFELAEGGLRFLLPIHLAREGIGPEGIGIVVAVFALTSLVARGLAGGAFRYDRARRLIVLAGIASTGAFLFLPFTDSVAGAALLMAGDGFGWGMATTVLLAVVMSVSPSAISSASAMGWYVGFQGIALAAATSVGGILAQLLGVETAMLLLASIPALAGVLIALRLPRPDDPRLRTRDAAPAAAGVPLRSRIAGAPRSVVRTLMGLPTVVWAAAVVAAYLNVMNGSLQSFFPLLGLSLGMTLAQVGTLSTVRVGVSSLARFAAGPLFARVDARTVHLPLLASSALTVVALPWAAAAWIVALPVLALNGICRGLLRVTSGAAAMDALAGHQAGAAAAVMTAGLDVGKMIGPLVGGIVAAALGLQTMFVVVPLAFLGLYLVLDLAGRRGRSRPGTGGAPPAPSAA